MEVGLPDMLLLVLPVSETAAQAMMALF